MAEYRCANIPMYVRVSVWSKKSGGGTQWYKKQYFKIMFPMWLLLGIMLAINVVFVKNSVSLFSISTSFLGVAGHQTIPGMTHTWFITYILFCYLITPLLERLQIEKEKMDAKFLVKLGVLILAVEVLYVGKVVCLQPHFLACYITGYFLARREKSLGKEPVKLITRIIIIASLALLPIRLFLQYGDNLVAIPGSEAIKMQIINWHHSLMGIALFFIGLFAFSRIKENRIFNFFDKYSYSIYLVHQIFILGTFSMLHITKYLVLNCIIIVVVICFSAVVLGEITKLLQKKGMGKLENKHAIY